MLARLEAFLAARWPESRPEQRRLPALIAQRIFVALLPPALMNGDEQQSIVRELKTVLYRYWYP